ncbi:MAG TPA: LysR family transcriptional regulator [Candidatus Anaerostipes avistercoris]|uniref:LysR family transcriptional regulator n=1 Tax=Candidatus Anaerostipes avistercoris TaxID=2838462 RepID=A0A9D2T7U6_9FIRM|nr:LysR family transcriptional regulator [Candidatus Anaerostipes avistercoris]
MEIQQLYYYMELCRHENFTEAGYACNMTQGALSKQIKKLETELGVTLIRRNTRKFELSAEGEEFLKYARKMTDLYEEMLSQIQKKREIRIGSMPVLAPYHFARIMADFHEKHPDIQLIVDEKKGRDILEDADSYDFMILRESIIKEKEKFRFHPLYEDRLCAVVYEDHPLAERKEIQLKELEGEIFVFPLKGSGSYEFFYDSCHKAGFVPDIQYEFPQANTIMSFVKEHVGITVTFTKVFEEVSLSCQGIRMIPLTDDFRSPISLIYPRKQPLDPAEKMFLKYIRSL